MTKQQLRQFWFQIHKWLGLTLAILVIPISLTGAALVWHDQLELALNPERDVQGQAALKPSAYAAAAVAQAGPGEKLATVVLPPDGGAVVATLAGPPPAGGGRPVRTSIYLHPADARLLDKAKSNEGIVHVMHVLHGSLMIPGMGRQIVGWIGVAMLISSLTGLWLWWPLTGRLTRGLRWRRKPETSANLHYQGGFWIALPLAVLSLTGAWISFPAFFAGVSGDPAGPSPAERMRRMAAQPIVATEMTADEAVALASTKASGSLAQIGWPSGPEAKWKVSIRGTDGPVEVTVEDGSGKVTPPKPPQPETTARLMRRIHDGTGMGIVWQVIIFIGGIIPAVLAVTGILMWLKVRRRRRKTDGRTGDRPRPELVPAE
jgi:uncharacterized iron-regulated membrane protein